MIEREIRTRIQLTPEELASEFAEMDDREQARFFSLLAFQVKGWPNPVGVQLLAVARNPHLTEAGRQLMREIGEYGREGGGES